MNAAVGLSSKIVELMSTVINEPLITIALAQCHNRKEDEYFFIRGGCCISLRTGSIALIFDYFLMQGKVDGLF
jgi:hypothetical protein